MMAGKVQQASARMSQNSMDPADTTQKYPPESRAILSRVEELLQDGHAKQAMDLLARSKAAAPWATNLTGVCLLRLGQAQRAVELFRNLVLSGSLFLRPEVPTEWKVNFATALLLNDNVAGCIRLLAEIQQEHHPGVQRLRTAIHHWQKQLSTWQKVQWFLGTQPARPVELDFPPGEL